MKPVIKGYAILILFLFLSPTACSHGPSIPKALTTAAVYVPTDLKRSRFHGFAPVFLIPDTPHSHDRIGRPSARYDSAGNEKIYIDTHHPAIYFSEKKFKTARREYTNLIYRIHFPGIPASLFPFYLGFGNNVGLMVIVTLDSRQRPVLVTTAHTCGCYLAMVPTSFLPKDALPKKWNTSSFGVYGETLPGMLDYESKSDPRLLISLRPDVHRVADMRMVDAHTLDDMTRVAMPVVSMATLAEIPINGGSTSFYYEKGILKGYVKGSVKYWETLFLSLISLDFFVGTDKAYKDSKETGKPFYTSLKPWNRSASDMWHFDRFLTFWGWKL
ncbi:MAG: hypothetical protein JEZ12_09260 [Desulfobacterium sp.]|nr:hypothetical protein [Desulfobacterium sp.]